MKTLPPLKSACLITCILPKGIAQPLAEKLLKNHQIVRANLSFARGSGIYTLLETDGKNHFSLDTEKEILKLVVPKNQANEIFEFIYFEAKIYLPHQGFIFMNTLKGASEYPLPSNTNLSANQN